MRTKVFLKAIAFCVILLDYSVVTAQDIKLDWAKRMGGVDRDYCSSITTDASGNIYTTGSFEGTVDFDPSAGTYNLTSAGEYDIFIQKLDADGNFLWAKSMGGTDGGGGSSICTDASGNIYTTGSFGGTVDFDPSDSTYYYMTAADYSDIYIQKLDSSGNFVWAKRMGGIRDDHGISISIDASGNIYTTGTFERTADFDPSAGTYNLTSAGEYDIFIQKLDSSGNFVWAKRMGGTENDFVESLTTDASGNIYTTGDFERTVDFDPSDSTYNLTSVGENDVFIQKLDVDGNFLWAKAMGGTDYDHGCAISTDASGNIYTTGDFDGKADFDPSDSTYNLYSAGYNNIFIQKLDSSGNFLWAKSIRGYDRGIGRSISIDKSGNIYTTGYFEGLADFNPSEEIYYLSALYGDDIFIQKLDSSGNFLWAKSLGGGDGNDYGFSISTDASGNIYITGYFEGTVDFDPSAGTYNLTSAGLADIFVAKYSESLEIINDISASGIKVYPNPTSGVFYLSDNNMTIQNIEITDISGKTVKSFQIKQPSNFKIDLSRFESGIYIISIQTDKEIFTTKVVKE